MKWEEFEKQKDAILPFMISNKQITDIDCPKCGKKLYMRTDIVLASYPPQNQYECECGWVGYN